LHATVAFVGGKAASEVAMMMYRATNIWLLTEPLRTRASAFRHRGVCRREPPPRWRWWWAVLQTFGS